MASSPVISKIDGPLLSITFNRPEARNAANLHMFEAFESALVQAEDDAIRCVMIRGTAGHFMAGGDLKLFAEVPETPMDQRHAKFSDLIEIAHKPLKRLRTLAKPVVAVVEGAAAGYGLSVLNNCDLAIAADTSFYSVAYTAIGTSPDGGGTYALTRLLGMKKAMQLALLNERLSATEALDVGLVNYLVPTDQLDVEALILCTKLAGGPTLAFAKTKALLWAGLERDFQGQLEAEKDAFAKSTMTDDFAEGVNAFLQRRRPEFMGR